MIHHWDVARPPRVTFDLNCPGPELPGREIVRFEVRRFYKGGERIPVKLLVHYGGQAPSVREFVEAGDGLRRHEGVEVDVPLSWKLHRSGDRPRE